MLVWLAVVSLTAYLAIVCALFVFQRRLLYLPDTNRPQLGELVKVGVREVTLKTGGGLDLLGWYLPPERDRPLVLYFHGNGGNIGYRAERLRFFAANRYGVLMPEYRGYGGNPGNPSETGLLEDGESAIEFVAQQGIEPRKIVLYGESLGSGVAVPLAAKHETAALVLESPFTSIAAVALYHYPFVPAALLVRDRFDALRWIGRVRAPILVIHGDRDSVTPVHFGQELFAAAPEPKEGWFLPLAGHHDLYRFGAPELIERFIERWVH